MIKQGCVKVNAGETRVVSVKEILASLNNLLEYPAIIEKRAKHTKVIRNLDRKDFGTEKEWNNYQNDLKVLMDKKSERGVGDLIKSITGSLNLLNPSTFLSIFSFVKDMRMLVADEKMERMAYFATNNNQSWIIYDHDIEASVPGNTDKPDKKLGYRFFFKHKRHPPAARRHPAHN